MKLKNTEQKTTELETQYSMSSQRRNSLLLLAGLLLFALLAGIFYRKVLQEEGTTVVVTVDGTEYYRGSLFTEKELQIGAGNTLLIRAGKADMIFADCPDQVCVNHEPISKVGETIICLPNKVAVTIENVTGRKESLHEKADVTVR